MRRAFPVALAAIILAGLPFLRGQECPLDDLCREGAIGKAEEQAFAPLSAPEVDAIARAAASSLNAPMTIAVVDRAGRVLALYRKPAADVAKDDRAVGVARTAAFFSNNQAPLSSRTVRFISGVHFPPGVVNAPNAPLYGIENSNRGCDLNLAFNAGKCVPAARSLNGQPCSADDSNGCGPGILTGKILPDDADPDAVEAGGIPLYRIVPPGLDRLDQGVATNGKLVGAIGVVGAPEPSLDEFSAMTGAFGALNGGVGAIIPLPSYPLPDPQNVFIGGIRLPFLSANQRLRFDNRGLPIGLQRPQESAAGADNGAYSISPRGGGCAASGYLVGPETGSALSKSDVDGLVQRAIASAKRTRGIIRLPPGSYARMVIAVGDVDGTILALYRMEDATVFSIDVAVAKARNVVYFSSEPRDLPGIPRGTAVTNRTIGFGAQPLYPPGIDSRVFTVGNGPFYPLFLNDLQHPCSQGSQLTGPNQNGVVFFPGATPLFRDANLVGGLGVSGDGVDQDDYVTVLAAADFLPAKKTWADRIKVDAVRLPMFKFPRQPEGVTECGGEPCP